MKKIFHLSSCDTCQRIIKEIAPGEDVILQDIKKEPITADQLEAMKNMAGSYERLFSKVAKKYKAMGLNEMTLKEADYKKYILIEYTFLKRPVMIAANKIFIGNSPQAVEGAKQAMHG
ncbi:arsenate reductase [soil metagenome]